MNQVHIFGRFSAYKFSGVFFSWGFVSYAGLIHFLALQWVGVRGQLTSLIWGIKLASLFPLVCPVGQFTAFIRNK